MPSIASRTGIGTAIGLGALLLAGICFYGFALDHPAVSLISYKHTSTAGVDEIQIDNDRFGIVQTRLEETASDLSIVEVAGDVEPTVDGKAELAFLSPEDNVAHEVAYVAFLVPKWCRGLLNVLPGFLCAARGHIELIRQPPALLNKWGMKRDTGYVILGRTDLEVPAAVVNDLPTVAHQELLPPNGLSFKLPPAIDSALHDAPAEVREAARLTAWLYKRAVRTGPTPRPYSEFLHLSLAQRVASLRSGVDAVMCAGFRDLWLSAAASSPIMGPVRHVGGYAFQPSLGDIIPFSHAVAEFWVESLHKWVLIDPWFGFSLKRDGEFLGVADLLDAKGEADGIEMVPLVPAIRRFSFNRDQRDSWDRMTETVQEAAPKLDEPTFSSSYQPGYLQYFRAVEFGSPIGVYGQPVYDQAELGGGAAADNAGR